MRTANGWSGLRPAARIRLNIAARLVRALLAMPRGQSRFEDENTSEGIAMNCQATYSPDDNKLRLRFTERLPPDLYKRVREEGYIWAPKQDLFVAPMWTPAREDLALELAGEIEDEDTSLLERAEDRAERFETYAEKRAEDADRAREHVAQIADGIPLGSPILVGHHSEKHARKDAERIENGMRKAIKAFETSTYWERRAKGAISHAKYKEIPDVRVRRISGLEADERKQIKDKANAEKFLEAWGKLIAPGFLKTNAGEESTPVQRAAYLASCDRGAWLSAMDVREGKLSPEDAQAKAIATHTRTLTNCNRWLAHLANRLTYERAMLAASGWVPPTKADRVTLPLLNYSGPVTFRDPYSRDAPCTEEATPITKAQLAALGPDYKGTRISSCGTHRVRYACIRLPGDAHSVGRIVFVTDSKQHPRPTPEAQAAGEAQGAAERQTVAIERVSASQARFEAKQAEASAKAAPFKAMKESLRAGVQVVVAPLLFEAPKDLARRAVALLGCTTAGMRVLEPSAGTGSLVRAIINSATGFDACLRVAAVEINARLIEELQAMQQRWVGGNGSSFEIVHADFLTLRLSNFEKSFDAVVMNPPFDHGIDIDHIKHALTFLKSGGKLVAICAGGPRQEKELKPLTLACGGLWERLPPGTFAAAGTNVATVLLTITKE
jgi:phospholipid N-methyltransferase